MQSTNPILTKGFNAAPAGNAETHNTATNNNTNILRTTKHLLNWIK